MNPFLPIKPERMLFRRVPVSRPLFDQAFSARHLANRAWRLRWFVRSSLGPLTATAGFVLLLAYALVRWCVQP